MRYLRQTVHDPMGSNAPMTILIPEDSLKYDIWTVATNLRTEGNSIPMSEFVDIEISECDPSESEEEAKRREQVRMDPMQRHRLTLYDWLISLFQNKALADKGLISTTKPSPLEKSDLFQVIMEATKHPAYRQFVIQIHDKNFEPVSVYVER